MGRQGRYHRGVLTYPIIMQAFWPYATDFDFTQPGLSRGVLDSVAVNDAVKKVALQPTHRSDITEGTGSATRRCRVCARQISRFSPSRPNAWVLALLRSQRPALVPASIETPPASSRKVRPVDCLNFDAICHCSRTFLLCGDLTVRVS